MLQQDPKARVTAAQALKHRFVAEAFAREKDAAHGGADAGAIDAALIARLRRFAAAPALRRLAVLVEAHLMGPNDDDQIRRDVRRSARAALSSR